MSNQRQTNQEILQKVSVVIPAYNSEKYIIEAIESVLSQTYQNFEIVIVDDGSSDHTAALIKPYLQRYPEKIRYYYQNNQGSSTARNQGMRQSRGEYIAFLDADDIWLPEKLKKQIRYLKENPVADLIFSNAQVMTEDGKDLWKYVKKNETDIKSEDMFNRLLFRDFIPMDAVVMRRSVINSTGYFNEKILASEDYDYMLRIARRHSIHYLNSIEMKYRISPHNKSSNRERRLRMTIDIIKNHLPFQKNNSLIFKIKIRQHLATLYFDLAYILFAENRLKEAHRKYGKTFRSWPFLNLKLYGYFFASFLPANIIQKIRILKRRHHST